MIKISALVSLMILSSCATAPMAPASSVEPVVVPFTIDSGRPVVAVTARDGSSMPMVFDTGAQGVTVTQADARRVGMAITGTVQVGSPNGNTTLTLDRVDTGQLRLGGALLDARQAAVAPPGAVGLPETGTGVIGPLMFPNSVVEINFPSQTITIAQRPSEAPPAWFPLDSDGFLSGSMTIAGKDVRFTMDAGNPMGAVMPLSLVRELAPSATMSPVGRVQTVGSSHAIHIGRVDLDFQLGGLAGRIGTAGGLDGGPDYVNLGSMALSELVLVIDNPNRRWGLRGRFPDEVNMPMPQRRPPPG